MTAPVNAYEAACERFIRASENYPKAKAESERILLDAEREWDEARDGLRQFEQSDGVPLPGHLNGGQS